MNTNTASLITRVALVAAALLSLPGCVVLTFDGEGLEPAGPEQVIATLSNDSLLPPRRSTP